MKNLMRRAEDMASNKEEADPMQTPEGDAWAVNIGTPKSAKVPPADAATTELLNALLKRMDDITEQLKMQKDTIKEQELALKEGNRGQDPGKPQPVDRKVFDRPGKYSGDIKKYIQWNHRFVDYLETQDRRWRKILKTI